MVSPSKTQAPAVTSAAMPAVSSFSASMPSATRRPHLPDQAHHGRLTRVRALHELINKRAVDLDDVGLKAPRDRATRLTTLRESRRQGQEAAGSVTGDENLKADGRADQAKADLAKGLGCLQGVTFKGKGALP